MKSQETKNIAKHSEFYLTLNPYKACSIAEGFCEGEEATDDQRRDAWQYIYDTRMYLSLQGWYGRTLQQLIAAGEVIA